MTFDLLLKEAEKKGERKGIKTNSSECQQLTCYRTRHITDEFTNEKRLNKG